MDAEILPCPACGGVVASDEYDDTDVWPEDSPKTGHITYRAVCNAGEFGRDSCGYCGPFADTEAAAIAAHNRIARAARERDELRAILADCVLSMDSWAADEDGIHTSAWPEYVRAREALGFPVVMSGTPEEIAEGGGTYRTLAAAMMDKAAAIAATAPAVNPLDALRATMDAEGHSAEFAPDGEEQPR